MFLDWFTILYKRFGTTPCINLYPTIACVVCKNGNHKSNTIAQYAMKSSELSTNDFYCVLIRTAMNLIAFWGPINCVNTSLIWGYE